MEGAEVSKQYVGISLPADRSWLKARVPAAGRGLVWSEDEEMAYSNWESHLVAPSVLSPNSCFWIQSNSGLWKPGSCRNRTHGVICKKPRGEQAASEGPQSLVFTFKMF